MQKKLIVIIALLLVCIAMMAVSLIISAQTFAQISSYVAICCVVVSLVGVVIIIRSNKHQ